MFKSMMKRNNQQSLKRKEFLAGLQFENLEDRNLLAGDIGAAFAEVAEGEDMGNYILAPSTMMGADGYQSNFSLGKDPLVVAVEYLQSNAGDFGLTADDLGSYRVLSKFVSQHTRVTHIALQQQYNNIDVLGSVININVENDGRIVAAGSSFLPGLGDGGTTDPLMTNTGPIDALTSAFSALGLTVTESPTVLQPPSGQNQSTIISDSGVTSEPIPAALGYTYNGSGVELAWVFGINTKDGAHTYAAFVSAESGEYLMSVDGVLNATYNVIPVPALTPDQGSQQVIEDPADLLVSPFGWHDINGVVGPEFTDTRGNNVRVETGILGSLPPNSSGVRADGGVDLEFLDIFDPDLEHDVLQNQLASTTNTFFTINQTHDVLARYGFDEAAGNFQTTNYTGTGFGSDALLVNVDDPDAICNAFAAIGPPSPSPFALFDGNEISLTMGYCDDTPPTLPPPFNPIAVNRDIGMDNFTVIHEFGHALTARLIGGPIWMQGAFPFSQMGGMHEGNSDFLALISGMQSTDDPSDANETLFWWTDNQLGRRQAYSYDFAINDRTFDDWNTFNDPVTGVPNAQVHQAGEIWASMLYDMTWELIFKYGGVRDGSAMEIAFNEDLHQAVGRTPTTGQAVADTGPTSMIGPNLLDLSTGANNLAMQLFIDGMKYSIINPTFTQARDGILAADQALTGGVNHDALWRAFARRGLGFGADGGFTTGQVPIVTGYDLPPTPADITGNIFIDADGDGVRQITESPLPGVTVYMDLNDNGTHERLEPYQSTDVDGNYIFELYLGGAFSIKALPQTNFRQTLPDPTQFEGGPVNDGGRDVYVVTGASTNDVDFGFKPSGQVIGVFGTKYGDENANGVQDPGETGIAGVYIYVDLDNDARIDMGEPAAITDEDGNYNIIYNEAGPATIREVLDPGFAHTVPANGQNDIIMILGLPALDVDFGNNTVVDYGDAPDTYDAAGAASHGIADGLFMGAGVDAEVGAQSGAFANGDDNSDTDDEDGVTFTSQLIADTVASVDVEISASDVSDGVIQAWIDFDADGVFDADEQILKDRDVVAGTNTFTFNIPADAQLGDTYARFRYGYERGLGPNGAATAGEVEDYFIGVLTDQPLAVDDRFEVDVNSGFNTLLVMQNDLASSSPPITVVGVTVGDSGAIIQVAPGGTHVLYKPALADIDGDSFDYTIQDAAGNQSVATVTIVHLQPSESYPNLFAVDDYTVVVGDAVAPAFTDIDVAANDHSGQADPVVVLAVIDGPVNGTASIHSGLIRYTPNPNFFGLDKLTYTITNALGVDTHKGNVAIQVTADGVNPADDDISYIVQAIHPTSGALVDSVDIEVGETLTVQVSVQDGRSVVASDAGIFAAYLDLVYGRDNLQMVTDSLTFGASFPNGQSGNLSVPGLVDEAGAFQDLSVVNGSAPLTVFTVDFRGLNPGITTVQSDPADVSSDSPVPGTSPLHDTLTINPAAAVAHNDINFRTLTVAVTSGSGEGELDINQDGAVTPLDALNIINNLNTNGSRALAEGEELSYDNRLDVNRDDYVTPLDALSIINYLNNRTNIAGGMAEGEFTPTAPIQSKLDTSIDSIDIVIADTPAAAGVDEWMRVRENEIGLSMFVGGSHDSVAADDGDDLELAINSMADDIFGEWL